MKKNIIQFQVFILVKKKKKKAGKFIFGFLMLRFCIAFYIDAFKSCLAWVVLTKLSSLALFPFILTIFLKDSFGKLFHNNFLPLPEFWPVSTHYAMYVKLITQLILRVNFVHVIFKIMLKDKFSSQL